MIRTKQPIRDLSRLVPRRPNGGRHTNGRNKHGIVRAFAIDPNDLILTTKQRGPGYADAMPIDMSTPVGQHFLNRMAELVDQRGGPDNITPAEKMLIADIAIIDTELAVLRGLYLESEGRQRLDPHVYGSLAKVRRGIVDTVGLKRRKRTISPRVVEGNYSDAAD